MKQSDRMAGVGRVLGERAAEEAIAEFIAWAEQPQLTELSFDEAPIGTFVKTREFRRQGQRGESKCKR